VLAVVQAQGVKSEKTIRRHWGPGGTGPGPVEVATEHVLAEARATWGLGGWLTRGIAFAGTRVLSDFAPNVTSRDWKGAVGLCSLQDCEHNGCTTEMKQTATAGGDMLAVTGAETEKCAKLVIASAEALGCAECLRRPAYIGSGL
jgi:hypothetical protein